MKTKGKQKGSSRYLVLYLMMIPGALYLIINNYIPMAGIILAFKKFNYSLGIWKSPFNGVDNFKILFAGDQTVKAVTNTILYNIVFTGLGMVLAIAVAIALSIVRSKRARNIYQTVILIPHLISIIIVAYMTFGFLSTDRGILNSIIKFFGGTEVSWYTTPKAWPFILTFISLWKSFGYSSIIYYTTILGIDPSLYEAAALDGATRWQQIKSVTLPALKTTIVIMLILSAGRIFNSDFGLFFQVPMQSGPLLGVTQTVDTYIYRALINNNDVGRSAAGGLLQSVLGFVLVLVTNYIVTKIDEDSAIFK